MDNCSARIKETFFFLKLQYSWNFLFVFQIINKNTQGGKQTWKSNLLRLVPTSYTPPVAEPLTGTNSTDWNTLAALTFFIYEDTGRTGANAMGIIPRLQHQPDCCISHAIFRYNSAFLSRSDASLYGFCFVFKHCSNAVCSTPPYLPNI